jgi:hypothetical protein
MNDCISASSFAYVAEAVPVIVNPAGVGVDVGVAVAVGVGVGVGACDGATVGAAVGGGGAPEELQPAQSAIAIASAQRANRTPPKRRMTSRDMDTPRRA